VLNRAWGKYTPWREASQKVIEVHVHRSSDEFAGIPVVHGNNDDAVTPRWLSGAADVLMLSTEGRIEGSVWR
jgi:hypothetical protein